MLTVGWGWSIPRVSVGAPHHQSGPMISAFLLEGRCQKVQLSAGHKPLRPDCIDLLIVKKNRWARKL